MPRRGEWSVMYVPVANDYVPLYYIKLVKR
jgi:hypothetical protein